MDFTVNNIKSAKGYRSTSKKASRGGGSSSTQSKSIRNRPVAVRWQARRYGVVKRDLMHPGQPVSFEWHSELQTGRGRGC